MRLLIHGLQSSGASTFTYFLAERPDCLALVDILNFYAAPYLDTSLDQVAKCTVTTAFPFALHAERFRPDRTILLLRDPRDNYVSLRAKPYRNHSGLMDEKFALIERLFLGRGSFDAVIAYEDFVDRKPVVIETVNRLGWPVSDDFYRFERTQTDMVAALWRHVPGLFRDFELSFGNCDPRGLRPGRRAKPREPEVEVRLEGLCPSLLDFYRTREAAGA
ncbi:hypothetical protein [Telmatospirillum siberiense]|uniref:Sulfotransferase domain-containing protein n=1 Tax=Telmatospirillum siberiense TaxID=382514 RepID=A0A2N3PZU4_9PROT|nr:hypothetical protein [Telmatospirillum siberiense]PKU25881.1 hypothetical protein CWS72_04820 [Telmatospirillum siberiense]